MDKEIQEEHQLQKTEGVFSKAILQIWKNQETSQIIRQMAGRRARSALRHRDSTLQPWL